MKITLQKCNEKDRRNKEAKKEKNKTRANCITFYATIIHLILYQALILQMAIKLFPVFKCSLFAIFFFFYCYFTISARKCLKMNEKEKKICKKNFLHLHFIDYFQSHFTVPWHFVSFLFSIFAIQVFLLFLFLFRCILQTIKLNF